jgi:hypothetical protein
MSPRFTPAEIERQNKIMIVNNTHVAETVETMLLETIQIATTLLQTMQIAMHETNQE